MYSKNAIRIYSLLISIVLTIVIQQSGIKVYQISHNIKETIETKEEISTTQKPENMKEELEKTQEEREENQETWQLMIPKIDLIAPIQEGVEQDTIKKAVGHFPRN